MRVTTKSITGNNSLGSKVNPTTDDKMGKNLRPFMCGTCGKSYRTYSFLKKHMLLHIVGKPYRCGICGVGYNMPVSLKLHVASHKEIKSEVSVYKISFKLKSQTKSDLKEELGHMDDITKTDVVEKTLVDKSVQCSFERERCFSCSHCDKAFYTMQNKLEHERVHSDIMPFHCKVCDRRFKRKLGLKKHACEFKEKRPFKCKICGRPFSTAYALNNHMVSHKSEATYKCDQRKQSFTSIEGFQQHGCEKLLRSEVDGSSNNTCHFCNAVFSGFDELNEHLTTHDIGDFESLLSKDDQTNESGDSYEVTLEKTDSGLQRKFVCAYCNKSFSRKYNLDQHVQIHTGKKHKCNVCLKGYRSVTELKNHNCPVNKKEGQNTQENPLLKEIGSIKQESSSVQYGHLPPYTVPALQISNQEFTKQETDQQSILNDKDRVMFYCDTCKVAFCLEKDFQSHACAAETEENYRKGTRYPCPECTQSFHNAKSLLLHIRKHFKVAKEKPYTCEKCNRSFLFQRSLTDHNCSVHPPEKRFVCTLCNHGFGIKGHAEEHMRTHTGEKPFKCDVCKKAFNRKHTLKTHNCMGEVITDDTPFVKIVSTDSVRESASSLDFDAIQPHSSKDTAVVNAEGQLYTKSEDSAYRCAVCFQTFIDAVTFQYHSCMANTGNIGLGYVVSKPMADTRERNFKCSVCDKGFFTKGHLNDHMITHMDQKPYQCKKCSRSYSRKNHLKNHKCSAESEAVASTSTLPKDTDASNQIVCPLCGKTYPSRSRFHEHLKRTHSAEKPFKCNYCEKSYTTKSSLNAHEIWHTDKVDTQCHICGKTVRSIKNHMRFHSNQRPLKCDLCPFTTKWFTSLKFHKMKHTGEKPHQCEICGAAFVMGSRLKVHMRIHTGETPYKCEICGKEYSNSHGFRIHMDVHNQIKRHVCDICGSGFTKKVTLRNHMMRHHGQEQSAL